ncbi:MAG TPA: CHRD domain-containing protein [Vicinamibacteria bacterium]|nr:CHRD domain-containing protein [Vicinamibacteria bacterium]
MRKLIPSISVIAVILGVAVSTSSSDRGRRHKFEADLNGKNEVTSAGGAISTVAKGSFSARLSNDGKTLSYRLRYTGLEDDITQAHIHIGQFHTSGGISVFLCKTEANPGPTPDLTPFCPDPRSGEVEGTLTEANVFGPAAQGVAAGEFEELVRLMRAGVTYANVHSLKFPAGEIRGQIRED